MKRKIFALLMTVVMVFSMTAAFAEEPVKSRTITLITHVSLDTPSELSGVIGGLIEEYKALHPEFELEYEIVGLTNLVGKVKTLSAGDALPDLLLYEPGIPLAELIEADKLVNLEEELTKMGVWEFVDPQVATLLKSMSAGTDKPLYGLPGGQHIEGIFYNKKIFEEHQLEVPKTLDELLAICEKLRAANIDPFLFGGKDKWHTTRLISNLANRIMGYTATADASDGKRSFLDEGFVKACTIAQDMGTKGYLGIGFNSVEFNTAVETFLMGGCAMLYTGTFSVGNMNDPNLCGIGSENIGFFSFPEVEGGLGTSKDYVAHAGQVLVANKATWDDAVADFVKYIVTHAGNYSMEKYQWLMGYAYDPVEELPPVTKLVLEAKGEAENLMLWWETRMDSKTTDVAKDNAQLMLAGEMDVNTYLQLIQESTNEFLGK